MADKQNQIARRVQRETGVSYMQAHEAVRAMFEVLREEGKPPGEAYAYMAAMPAAQFGVAAP